MLVKDGLIHRLLIKALLYPNFYEKTHTSGVRLRRQHCTRSIRRRQSICSSKDLSQCESESNDACDTSATSSIGFILPGKQPSKESTSSQNTFVDHGAGMEVVDCTKEIFAEFENMHANDRVPCVRDSDGSLTFCHTNDDCDIGARDSLKYYSKPVKIVIDRRQANVDSYIHTSTAKLIFGDHSNTKEEIPFSNKNSPSEESEMSSYKERSIRGNMAFEDLVNIDESMKIKGSEKSPLSKKMSKIDERHSMPTLFVGNRFNCSSLTSVFIPSYKDKLDLKLSENASNETLDTIDDEHEQEYENNRHSNISTATHSSSIDIPPAALSTELIFDPDGSPQENVDNGNTFLIKPPSMFVERSRSSKNSRNSDQSGIAQPDASSLQPSETKDKRCVSYHYINLQNEEVPPAPSSPNNNNTQDSMRKCGCCAHSPCVSQRSSDSGMAGSCTISSPDAPNLTTETEYDQSNEPFLPDIERRLTGLTHSQSTHNFGRFNEMSAFADSNHDSGQYGNEESENEQQQQRDSSAMKNMFELSTSQDTVKRKSRCQSAERSTEQSQHDRNPQQTAIFKTGMYAHWWKKEMLPVEMLRDIYRLKMKRESNSTARPSIANRGSGKTDFSFECDLC